MAVETKHELLVICDGSKVDATNIILKSIESQENILNLTFVFNSQ